jgi:hypothetical protein
MSRTRAKRREARLLVAVAMLARQNNGRGVELDDLLGLDFLLSHPAALRTFIGLNGSGWPKGALPSDHEAASSEETFLRWKRSVALEAAAPLLGRLLARKLIAWSGDAELVTTDTGSRLAVELTEVIGARERERVDRLALEFVAEGAQAHERLRRSLTEGTNNGN